MNGGGQYTAVFKTAFNRDLEQLTDKDLSELRLLERGPVERRDEVFADIYGHVSGLLAGTECNSAYSLKIKKAFPNCLKQLLGEIEK